MKLSNLIAAGLTATLLATGASYAQTAPTAPAEVQIMVKNQMAAQMPEVLALVNELKAQGYTYIEIRRSLLGRAIVKADGPNGTREVVISTSTGEVMRDATHDGEHMAEHGDMADTEHGNMGDNNHDGAMGESDNGNMGENDHGNMGENDHGTMGSSSMGGGMGGN